MEGDDGRLRVECKVKRNVFTSKDNKFHIFGCEPIKGEIQLNKYGNFTIKGSLGMIEVGKEYTFDLEEIEDRYGISYQVTAIPSFDEFEIGDLDDITDDKEYQMLKLIMSDEQAENVHKAYPTFIRLILSGESDKIDCKQIYNVGKVRLKAYIAKVNNMFKYYKLVADNADIELKYAEAEELCSIYGSISKVQEFLTNNPYFILCYDLKRPIPPTDRLLLKVRPDMRTSVDRCEIVMLYLLQQNEADGNTRIAGDVFYKYVAQWDTELVPVMMDVIDSPNCTLVNYDKAKKILAINHTYLAEKKIADDIWYHLAHNTIWKCDTEKYKVVDGFEITNEQSKILDLLCTKNTCMLMGSAGTGKTSSVKAIITMLDDLHKSYRLLSPTGIAAKRLKEATGRDASTIHRAVLGEGIIDEDVVIIDEASMIGVELLAELLTLVSPLAKILFVFDSAQLASISCGNVVHDLIRCGKIPTAELTKVFRYGSSGISTVATDTRRGAEYLSDTGQLLCENAENVADYVFVPADEEPMEQIIDEYDKLRERYDDDEILVISPYNIGAFGTYAINNRIQTKYNPNAGSDNCMKRKLSDAPNGAVVFYEGDKVINKMNNYHAKTPAFIDWKAKKKRIEYNLEQTKELDGEDSDAYFALYENLEMHEANAPKEAAIMNGDIGYIKRIDGDYMYIQFDEDMVIFDKGDLQNLLLAYACSAHSVQGCEIKAVILITCNSHARMLTRNLCYMSLTRAKEMLVQIGDINAINHALTINETTERETWLYDLLMEEPWEKIS